MISNQLKTFFKVIETGSFTKAAEALYVTPASVMNQINILEGRLGFKLFFRNNQGVRLTPEGQIVYENGKKMETLERESINNARLVHGIKKIRIGSSFINNGQLLINYWRNLFPDRKDFSLRLVPFSDDRSQILSVINSLGKDIDVVVGIFGTEKMKSVTNFLPLGRAKLCIALPSTHPLATQKRLSVSDLSGQNLIMPSEEKPGPVLSQFLEYFKKINLNIQMIDAGPYYDFDTFVQCEENGNLLLTYDIWANTHPSLVTLPVDWDYRTPYGILYSKHPSKTVSSFIEVLSSKFLP